MLLASQLDLLHAITDPSNSYDSHVRKWGNTIGLSFSQTGHEGYTLYTRWEVGLDIPVLHHTIDYQRGAVDTLMNDTWVYFLPYAAYRYKSPGSKHQLEVRADFKCEPVDLVSQIAYRDNSNPLVVKLGNPALKGRSTTHIYADYTRKSVRNPASGISVPMEISVIVMWRNQPLTIHNQEYILTNRRMSAALTT